MAEHTFDEPQALSRVRTGVPGLDEIIGGGLLKSGVYIIQGPPGAGKTILANQICFNHATHGGRAVYVTMLAESHARLFQHLRGMSFFDERALPESVYFVNGVSAFRKDGFPGVVTLLRREMREREAGIVVLDGLVADPEGASSSHDLKLFISEVQAHSMLTGCTTLLLASDTADQPLSAGHTMADGVLLLHERSLGPRRERNLEVLKFRGSATLRGNHALRIGPEGIVVYPMFEAAHHRSPGGVIKKNVVSTGIDGLDEMLAPSGLREGSVTAIAGFAGSGKTLAALHFAAQANAAYPALYFGFYESPEFLTEIGATFGLELARLQAQGALQFMWQPFGDDMLDEVAYRLIKAVRHTKAKRVVIDSIGGFLATPGYSERGGNFFAGLSNELRRLGVTTVITVEENDPQSQSPPVSVPSLSALSDVVISLRIQREDGRTRRFASIAKARNSRHDLQMRELVLTEHGLRVASGDGAEWVGHGDSET